MRGLVACRRGEDGAEQVLLEVVHHVVHVDQRCGPRRVAVGEGVDGQPQLHAGLLAHAVDEAADLGLERVRVEPARRLGHVDHEVADAFELVDHAQHA